MLTWHHLHIFSTKIEIYFVGTKNGAHLRLLHFNVYLFGGC